MVLSHSTVFWEGKRVRLKIVQIKLDTIELQPIEPVPNLKFARGDGKLSLNNHPFSSQRMKEYNGKYVRYNSGTN